MIVGAILQASSFTIAQLIVARIVSGVGNGMHTATIPVRIFKEIETFSNREPKVAGERLEKARSNRVLIPDF